MAVAVAVPVVAVPVVVVAVLAVAVVAVVLARGAGWSPVSASLVPATDPRSHRRIENHEGTYNVQVLCEKRGGWSTSKARETPHTRDLIERLHRGHRARTSYEGQDKDYTRG